MRIPLFGTGVSSGQKQVTVRKTVGMYWERRGETEKSPLVAVPFPGLDEIGEPGSGDVRGIGRQWGSAGELIVVRGSKAYTVNPAFDPAVATEVGTLEDAAGPVEIAPGPSLSFMVAAGGNSYHYDGTSTFTKLDEAFFSCTWMGGYWIAAKGPLGQFWISTDGTTWSDTATAEATPDPLRKVLATRNELFLFGEASVEVWSHTGDVDFPFARINGATSGFGAGGQRAVTQVGGAVYYIAQSEDGRPFVARMAGYSPERISTDDVDRIIGGVYAVNPAIMMSGFMWNGHPILLITSQSIPWTLWFDAATGLWGYVTDSTAFGAAMTVELRGAVYGTLPSALGDGKVYRLDPAEHNLPKRQIITDHVVSPDGERFTVDSLRLDMSTNVGASEKSVTLKVSRDGGLSWGSSQSVGIGVASGPQKKVEFRRLGTSRSFTFDLSFPTDVPLTVHSASLNASD